MNNKLRIKSVGIFLILCLLFAEFFFMNKQGWKKTGKKTLINNNNVAVSRDTFSTDLYYLKHPYLVKGDQFNDEEKYDSAIYITGKLL